GVPGGGGRPRRPVAERRDGAGARRSDGARDSRRLRGGGRDSRRDCGGRVRAARAAGGPHGPRPGARGARARRATPAQARRAGDRSGRGVLDGRGRREDARRVRDARTREGAIVAGTVAAETTSPAPPRVGLRKVRVAAIVVSLLSGVSPASAAELERLPAVLHVHSTLSTGDFSLDELAAQAEKAGVGALLLSENYLLRIEYGLPPFRALTRVAREARSILDGGAARFLDRVAEARARNPRVLIIPGVEAMPHYYWTGSPLMLDLTVHNGQKNMLVFGLVPHHALIDYVDRFAGVTVWSLPETQHSSEEWFGPLRVSRRTDPYPDDPMRTFRYTAFGAVYEDSTRFELPGGGWDQLLG